MPGIDLQRLEDTSIYYKDFKIKIYNFFPRINPTRIDEWPQNFSEIRDMGFDAIYINPFFAMGEDKCIYAISDFNQIDNEFSIEGLNFTQHIHFLTTHAHNAGLKVILDIVINHSDYKANYPDEWYSYSVDGKRRKPTIVDVSTNEFITFPEVAKFNYDYPARRELLQFWVDYLNKLVACGVDGFRFDLAFAVPRSFWLDLFDSVKTQKPDLILIPENLGCAYNESKTLLSSGFSILFSSFKWWEYNTHKLDILADMSRLGVTHRVISMPETHDTTRYAQDLKSEFPHISEIDLAKTCAFKYELCCLVSSVVMLTRGYEFVASNKLDVFKNNDLIRNGDIRAQIYAANILHDYIYANCSSDGKIEFIQDMVLRKEPLYYDKKESVFWIFFNHTSTAVDLNLPTKIVGSKLVVANGKVSEIKFSADILQLGSYEIVVVKQ